MNRSTVKSGLARLPVVGRSAGVTILTYHRVGGGSSDELDLPAPAFAEQVGILGRHEVVGIDDALVRLAAGDTRPCVVLTFDDGFGDVYDNAWPLLREARLPFTLYLATAFLGRRMEWEGSTGRSQGARALTWEQVAEMIEDGLCTPGNHTHHHVPPDRIDEHELDASSDAVESRLGVRPAHFAYPWGVRVPALEPALGLRFRSAVTGAVGRNRPGSHPLLLRRVPVRRTDPIEFFRRKIGSDLVPELAYERAVRVAKAVGLRA